MFEFISLLMSVLLFIWMIIMTKNLKELAKAVELVHNMYQSLKCTGEDQDAEISNDPFTNLLKDIFQMREAKQTRYTYNQDITESGDFLNRAKDIFTKVEKCEEYQEIIPLRVDLDNLIQTAFETRMPRSITDKMRQLFAFTIHKELSFARYERQTEVLKNDGNLNKDNLN